MVPKKWVVVERLPFLSSGKLDRRQVQAWVEAVDEETRAKLTLSLSPLSPSSTPAANGKTAGSAPTPVSKSCRPCSPKC
jgi:hypothetical protein